MEMPMETATLGQTEMAVELYLSCLIFLIHLLPALHLAVTIPPRLVFHDPRHLLLSPPPKHLSNRHKAQASTTTSLDLLHNSPRSLARKS